MGDVIDASSNCDDHVYGRALDCGDFLPEEAPDETYAELQAFFAI